MSDSVPQRIGDAERDRAADYLREHMSVGRLNQDEFDERVTAALQARTAADLEPLFSDLPAPKPGQDVAVAGGAPWPVYQPPTTAAVSSALAMPSSSSANMWGAIAAVSWVVWMIPNFVFGWHLWWLVFIPIVISSIAGQQKEELKRREKLWQKQQNRQLPPGSQTDPPTS
ncbi:MAG TPA: DUF1707 domain-containing protein [Microlunatus sp.]